ncbi:MAG: hypothetical protein PHQ43_08730 [Dehalococcoidales bacterium]|nr:hypothetical protein [Dehalococcoidales bacterium]
MPNFDPKPEGMPYGEWLRQKSVGIRVKEHIHTDSGLPYFMRPQDPVPEFEHLREQMPKKKALEAADI